MVDESRSPLTKLQTMLKTGTKGKPLYKKQVCPLQSYKSMERFTPLKLPINKVFNTFKDQPWVRCLKSIQYNSLLLGLEEYCSYHECKGHQTIHFWALRRYLKELIQQGFIKEYVLAPEAISGQPNTQPPRE